MRIPDKQATEDNRSDSFIDVIDSIELSLNSNIIVSNINRAAILYLLKNCPEEEMQAERIAYRLGLSHRTALYHLDILEKHGYVEVRKFVKKGFKNFRSVWGIADGDHITTVFDKIHKKFSTIKLENKIKKNVLPR
jgi:DNA-binding transcriptional ArsR family regulator